MKLQQKLKKLRCSTFIIELYSEIIYRRNQILSLRQVQGRTHVNTSHFLKNYISVLISCGWYQIKGKIIMKTLV